MRSDSLRSLGDGMVVSGITGNISRVSDSVIVNLYDSSHSNSSSSAGEEDEVEEVEEEEEEEEEDHEEDEEIDDHGGDDDDLHCDDWEIRMLAAELNRRESKREEPSSDNCSDVDDEGGGLLRLRKKSDTEIDFSETESDALARPRAASLDQHNTGRGVKCRSVFKAMSFDRDKDQL